MSETTVTQWTVGELANRSGVTARTLHYYDAIGLLRPGGRSESGYRHYGPDDVEQLYRIRSLRRPVHARVFAGDESEIWLHPESATHGLASPTTNPTVSSGIVVVVDDVDAHHRHAIEGGARIEYPPVDQPYGVREYGAHDLEGGHWYFSTPAAR